MSVEDNKQVLQNFVKAVLDGKNLNAADSYLAPNFLHHDLAPGEQTGNQTGREGQKTFFRNTVFAAFSGFQTSFQSMIGFGDLVAGHWVQSVQQTGPWLGRAPSNKRATIGGISIVRVRDGMIVEEWEGRDTAGLLTAFGVIPPPPRLEPGRVINRSVTPVPIMARILTAKPLPSGGAPGNAVSPSVISAVETVRSVAAKVITYVLNDGNLGAIDQIFGRGFIDHNKLNGQQDGIEGMKQFVDRFKSAFPDSTVTPDVSLAENDKAAVRWTATGTHRGMFLGIPPTGKKIKFSSIHLFRIAQNQVVEKWGYWPVAETLQQLSGAGPQQ